MPAVFVFSAASFWMAYEIRFEFSVPETHDSARVWMALFGGSLNTLLLYLLGFYCVSWRYVSLKDGPWFVMYVGLCSGLMCGASVSFAHLRAPRSVILIDGALTLILILGFSYSLRLARQILKGAFPVSSDRRERRVVIIDAGEGVEMLCREMLRLRTRRYKPLAFFDDNVLKWGKRIHGVKIVGAIENAPSYALHHKVHEFIMAIPSL